MKTPLLENESVVFEKGGSLLGAVALTKGGHVILTNKRFLYEPLVGAKEKSVSCPHCNEINLRIAKFCNSCGKKLQLECPNCNAPIDESKKFCAECGTPIKRKNECSKCGAVFGKGQKFCNECGERLGE